MLYALNKNDNKIRATPKQRAMCSCCSGEVIAKCGRIKMWHWAHRSKAVDCNFESETEWHLQWKSYAHPERCEIKIQKGDMYKIADIVLSNGMVVEVQHSPISVEEIELRERFYDKMMWIFDCRESFDTERIVIDCRENWHESHYCTIRNKWERATKPVRWAGSHYYVLRWKWRKKSIFNAQKPIFLDLGDFVFKVVDDYDVCIHGILQPKQKMINYIKDLGRFDYSEYKKYKFEH